MPGKKPTDVKGYQMNCPDYHKCPICFGCRNYDDSNYHCVTECGDKSNHCDTKKHRSDLIGKLLYRKTVEI